jgi:hypothetical protein
MIDVSFFCCPALSCVTPSADMESGLRSIGTDQEQLRARYISDASSLSSLNSRNLRVCLKGSFQNVLSFWFRSGCRLDVGLRSRWGYLPRLSHLFMGDWFGPWWLFTSHVAITLGASNTFLPWFHITLPTTYQRIIVSTRLIEDLNLP